MEEYKKTGSNKCDIERETAEDVLRIISKNMQIDLDATEDIHTNLYDRGLDSITYVKIIVCLEEKFDITFDDEFMVDVKNTTIEKIVQYILSHSHD